MIEEQKKFYDNSSIDDYELSAWIMRFGSFPTKQIAHKNLSESYEMSCAHVFELKSGQFALVTEKGDSSYEPKYADIDLFPTKAKAMESFNKWIKENKS